ncbi:MAG: DUF4397 domain-containing protein [Hungatella sp.]|nr:DUF4397 domain-containing protein [Hungatella sp.]
MAENNQNTSGAHLTPEDYGITTPAATDNATPAFSGNTNSNNDYGISLPIAPEGGIPAYPGNMGNGGGNNNDYGISLPIAPEGGIPAYPGNMNNNNNCNNCTIWPPITTLPIFPSCPGCNVSQSNAQVRFLNASTNAFPVSISIDNTTYVNNSRFGTVSNYDRISDGFHTVTVRRASGLRSVLLQQTFPFTGGQRYTMVLADAPTGGLTMTQVSNDGCANMNFNTGCYRVANFSYSGSSYDVVLYSHDAVFRNVGFREVTSYKQAMAGTYQFYVTNSNSFSVIRELPMIVIGAVTNTSFNNEPLVSFQTDIAAGNRYTSYLIGNNWSDIGFRVLTIED